MQPHIDAKDWMEKRWKLMQINETYGYNGKSDFDFHWLNKVKVRQLLNQGYSTSGA